MKRRDVVKLIAVAPASGVVLSASGLASAAAPAEPAAKSVGKASAGASVAGKVPDYAKDFLTSDMNGLGPDGKPTGQTMTFTGASQAGVTAETASKELTLTQEEQDILDGKEGEEKAKLMTILVAFGNTFGAEKLVDLGGAPHSNLFIGAPYMGSMIDMLDQCADAGLKSYATYTVNPRPYDVYNVQNNPKDMELIYQGYPLQAKLDIHTYIHALE
ncbi:unnamed protein product [marine sediment metagenome]|uniref:Phosphomevalonate dehydratase large subunit-like domain-containing protein n=1 Tax=marine sediment metagenome TaxID=412755 RepID=X1BRL8_9ZZZZ